MAKKVAARIDAPVQRLYKVRKNFFGKIFGVLKEVLPEMISSDASARKMAWLFALSLIGVVFTTSWMTFRFIQNNKDKIAAMTAHGEETKHLGDFIKKQADEARHRSATLIVGTFVVTLKEIPGKKLPPGGMNLGEVEIIIECDSRDTRNFMESQLQKVKNQITSVFTNVDREAILTREGKRLLRRQIIENLNNWLPSGKVEELYFTKFIIG